MTWQGCGHPHSDNDMKNAVRPLRAPVEDRASKEVIGSE